MNKIKTIKLICLIICAMTSISLKARKIEIIVTASDDRTARIWNLRGECLAILQGHRSKIQSVAVDPTGNFIVTGSADGTAKLWNLYGNCLVTLRIYQADDPYLRDPPNLQVAFSNSGNQIITAIAGGGCRVQIWDLNGNCLETHSSANSGFSNLFDINPCKNLILGKGRSEAPPIIWNFNSKEVLPSLQIRSNDYHFENGSFNTTGDRIVGSFMSSRSCNYKILIWDLNGDCLVNLEHSPESHPSYRAERISYVTFSPTDDKIIISFKLVTDIHNDYSVGKILIYDLQHHRYSLSFGLSHGVNSAVFNYTGNLIVTTYGRKAKILNLKGSCIATLQGHTSNVNYAVFSPCLVDFLDDDSPPTQQMATQTQQIATKTTQTEFPADHLTPPLLCPPNTPMHQYETAPDLAKHLFNLIKIEFLNAATEGNDQFIQEYANNEELLTARNFKGQPALHLATKSGHPTVVETLLNQKASPNLTDKDGNTPLHLVAGQQTDTMFDTVNILLKNGALITNKNEKGQTPLDIAKECNNDLIKDILLDWQFKTTEPARKEEQEATCCICLEPFRNNFVIGNSADPNNPCGHRIHEKCSKQLHSCPICLKNLNQKNPWIKIY